MLLAPFEDVPRGFPGETASLFHFVKENEIREPFPRFYFTLPAVIWSDDSCGSIQSHLKRTPGRTVRSDHLGKEKLPGEFLLQGAVLLMITVAVSALAGSLLAGKP